MTIMNRHTSSCVCQEATKLTSESNSFGEQLVQLGAMFSLFTRIKAPAAMPTTSACRDSAGYS